MKLTLDVPKQFDLWQTIYSHGWCVLPPFSVSNNEPWLRRTDCLSTGRIVTIRVSESGKQQLSIDVEDMRVKKTPLLASEKKEILSNITVALRLDEDYSEFYTEACKHAGFEWMEQRKAGRLLRSPTVFEDAVKMICTTNCSWSLTEIMVKNLCEKLGKPAGNGRFTFPTPKALANTTEAFLRKEIKAGYRSPYLLELGKRVASREVDMQAWRNSPLPADELFDALREVKGIGPYAAGNIMKLLGRYDYLALDSWCRAKFKELHGKGKVSDKTIERYYAKYGKWRGLFLWLDLTKDWYDKKFPI